MKTAVYLLFISLVWALAGCSGTKVTPTVSPSGVPDYSGFGSESAAQAVTDDSTCLVVLSSQVDSLVRAAGSGLAGSSISLTENTCHRITLAGEYQGQPGTITFSNEGDNPCRMTVSASSSLETTIDVYHETLCEFRLPDDTYEPDDQFSQAKVIAAGGGSQVRTANSNDQDWICFYADSGRVYSIIATNGDQLEIRLFDAADHAIPNNQYQNNDFTISFTPVATDTVYIRIQPKDQAVSYSITLN